MLKEALLETLWPTRCAGCERAGKVLCDDCIRNMEYIDAYAACPICGDPAGLRVCTRCNAPVEDPEHRVRTLECRSAAMFTGRMAKAIHAYKDAGETRLYKPFAMILARIVPPPWLDEADCVTCVPASRAAIRKRGFNHTEPLAQQLASNLGLPYRPLLVVGNVKDQRGLGRRQRSANMRHVLKALPDTKPPQNVLLIDDVMTTGATLEAATTALKDAGAQTVRCLTLARA
ncbi:ComF family protein [Slackia heliotrinireducens]|uniref:ComF family protein n=1 Tax=Slackia heliotrinireducens TaxID=84110 RepID=UPI003314AE69